LLVDATHALDSADVESVLRAKVTDVLGLNLSVVLLLLLGLLQGSHLGLGEHLAGLSDTGFKGLQALFEGLQSMPEPDTTHASSRDGNTASPELIAGTQLAECGVFVGQLNPRTFNLVRNPVLAIGLSASLFLRASIPPSSYAFRTR